MSSHRADSSSVFDSSEGALLLEFARWLDVEALLSHPGETGDYRTHEQLVTGFIQHQEAKDVDAGREDRR